MAQRKRKRGSLVRHLGLGRTRLVLACVALTGLLGAGGATLASLSANDALEIRRSAAVEEATGSGDQGADMGDQGASGGGAADSGSDGSGSASGAADGVSDARDAVPSAFVHVDGAVAHPGVYRIALADPRVQDAVQAAGGLSDTADTLQVNLAAPISDGMKVHIPEEGEGAAAGTDAAGGAAGGTAGIAAGNELALGASAGSDTGAVNINTADAAGLTALPGVGEATARSIIEDRERNGPFTSPEDIMRVSGIGQKKFEKMRSMIRV